MYLECLLIARNKTQNDEQVLSISSRLGSKNLTEVYQSKQYRSSIRSNRKYLDSSLTHQSRQSNTRLKEAVHKHNIQIVLVSPLKADLQTCLDIFGDNQNVSIVIDPLLVPRINSVAVISEGNLVEMEQFKHKPSLIKLEANPKWYVTFSKGYQGSEAPFEDCIALVSKDDDYETVSHFHSRLTEFKKDLLTHIGPMKAKIAVIAHSQVIEALTATGHHEDFTLINTVPFQFGEVKPQFVWVEGVQGEMETSGIPFCS